MTLLPPRSDPDRHLRRLVPLMACCTTLALGWFSGCIEPTESQGDAELSWGKTGVSDGRLLKPRAIAINADDELFIVDMTGRIQVFSRDGEFRRSWRTPEIEYGKPSGLSFDRGGHLLVADTHYHQMLVYQSDGELLQDRRIGGTFGNRPGEFGYVTDAVEDSNGNVFISEYGDFDRIQKFSPEGDFILQWGSHGVAPSQFVRPQNMTIDAEDQIWVVDACNHRVQVFDASGPEVKLVRIWGEQGKAVGQLSFPYDLVLDQQGHVYICEYGNHRIQKFDLNGKSLGVWGTYGRRANGMHQPWGLALDSQGCLHVLDTYNHRVHRVRM